MNTTTLSPLPEQTLRNADLPTLINRLQDNDSRRLDLVVQTSSI